MRAWGAREAVCIAHERCAAAAITARQHHAPSADTPQPPQTALKLSTAAAAKHPRAAIVHALRAVALERTGKMAEALKAAEDVIAGVPTDPNVLHTLTYVLRPAGRLGDLTAAYETAAAKDPGSRELLEGVFGCHVRDGHFVKQQQAALRLQKAFPSERFQWWVVDSIALQAHAAADAAAVAANGGGSSGSGGSAAPTAAAPGAAMGAPQLLRLAESMAARLAQQPGREGKLESVEALDLYLGILHAQGRPADALALLDGAAGEAMRMPGDRRHARAALLAAAGRRPEAAALYREAVEEQPDDWTSLMLFLDCTLPPRCSSGLAPPAGFWTVARALQSGGAAAPLVAADAGEEEPEEGAQSGGEVAAALAEARAFVEGLPTRAPAVTAAASGDNKSNAGSGASSSGGNGGGNGGGSGGGVLRGPVLAKVELEARRVRLGLAPPRALAEAALAASEALGHTLSCAMDLRPYVLSLPPDDAAWLSAQLSTRLSALAAAAEDEAAAAAATDGRAARGAAAVLRRRVAALQLQDDVAWCAPPPPATAGAGTAAAGADADDGGCPHLARALELADLFAEALPLSTGLDERERGPADELLPMAAASLVRGAAAAAAAAATAAAPAAGAQPPPVALLRAAAVLEAGARWRPHSADCRLGLAALYGLLGCAGAAAASFAKTDAKHIQLDTLASHHLLPAALALGAGDATAAPLLASTLALFEDHARDAGDTLMAAYSQGTHTKVLEFVLFRERLARAHSLALARAERALLALRRQLTGGGGGTGGGSSGGGGGGGGSSGGGAKPAGSSGGGAGAAGAAAAAASPEATAAAAAAALPLAELEGPGWRAMRFNADLQTRPAWLPPTAAAAHLAVLHWWEALPAAAAGAASGAWRPWWRRVAAAEADLPEAARARAAQRAGTLQRWLLPHLLAAALAPPGGSAGGGGDGSGGGLAALLPRFAAALGVEPADQAGIDAALAAAFGADGASSSGGGSSLPAARLLELLDLAVFSAAEAAARLFGAAHAAAAAGAADQEGAGAAAVAAAAADVRQRAGALAAALAALERRASEALAPAACARGLLPGSALSLAALLVDGGCLWAVACLEAWARAAKALKRKGGAKKSSGGGGASAAAAAAAVGLPAAALEALAAAAAAAARLLAALATAPKQLPAAADAEAALLAALDPAAGGAMRRLVGWEPRLSAPHIAKTALGEQRACLARSAAAAAALQKRAAAVAAAGAW